ncbi:hypothetical protein [Paraburkholderia bannensis]|uniref:hypothetical protein n=1 Tax=Paraburkholderia bannensis TaxID=765414 RepID=UPI002AC31829|nr:hypothetical protein [Paraburkholderia bannensis]
MSADLKNSGYVTTHTPEMRTMTIADDLSLLVQNHDDAPLAAADELRRLAKLDVPSDQLSRFAWLVDHVIGEKQGAWAEAYGLIKQAIESHETLQLPVLRYAAVAAHLGGYLPAGIALERRMMRESLSGDQASTAVRSGALSFGVTPENAVDICASLLSIVESVSRWSEPSGVDSLVAGSLNNIVSALLEQDRETVGHADVSAAMIMAAEAARTLWYRAGTWVNQERADYLCALVFNRLGDYVKALDAAERGQQVIETRGSEDVDRAFLILESARALIGLSRRADATERLRCATAITSGWDDDALKSAFDKKAQLICNLID